MIGSSRQSLNGAWQFRQAGSDEWLPATVPGGVHTDLLAAGRINDPFAGDEEKRVQWVAMQDWEYRRSFTVDAALLDQARVFLVCDGLDTLAEVRVNGQGVGSAENMFRPYRWEVRDALHPGENEIRILFRSPVQYTLAHHAARPLLDVNDAIHGAPYIRKAPCHFGWDWGPQVPAIGIWRDIRLEGYTAARLTDVHLRQQHDGGTVTLSATATAERYAATALRLTLRVTAPDGAVQTADAPLDGDRAALAISIENPQLWWPNDYGAQPLYQVVVALLAGDMVVDEWTYQVGLRTVALRQEPDEWGRSFTFVVNGVPIFAKGTNWIPADSFPTRITRSQLDHLLGSAAMAHNNMIRVWGGGYYEDEAFYDLCDHYGLLVWQDFMFACAVYPLADEALLANIQEEVIANVRRLRHRACLALWCGNNEMDTAWVDWGWDRPELQDLKAAYERFFYRLLPPWVAAEDPDHVYWPSSPGSGTAFVDPNGGTQGDVHQWAVWHALKPFSNYRETPARFVSEFGFQSLPALATIAAYLQPADWNMTSYMMEHHQKNFGGNGRIMTYLTEHFRIPRDFPALVYLTQLLQAEAMRIGVEGWRRDPACSGALYWQLNDCWPVNSWAGIDYPGRWKALHYASRRFFAPVLLAVEDNGSRLRLHVTNDTVAPWAGAVRWSLETLDGARLDGGVAPVTVDKLTGIMVQDLDFSSVITDENRRAVVLVSELHQDGVILHRAVTPFAPTKHLALTAPGLTIASQPGDGQLTIHLTARTLARFVALSLDGADVIFSDNYFDLPAARPVQITCPLPTGWMPAQAQAALQVRSLFDSY